MKLSTTKDSSKQRLMKLKNKKRLLAHCLVFCLLLLQIAKKTKAHLPSVNIYSTATKEFAAAVGANATINCTTTTEEFSFNLETEKRIIIAWKWIPQGGTEWIHYEKMKLVSGEKETEKRHNRMEHNQAASKNMVISTLRLSNVSVNASGVYGCFLEKSKTPLDQTVLHVGYPPDEPTFFRCETDSYLVNMNCFWEPGRQTYIDTNYQILYNITIGLKIENHATTTKSTRFSLDIASTFTFLYTFQIAAINALNTSQSEILALFPGSCVHLDAPKNVTISPYGDTDEVRSTCLFVRWEEPKGSTHLKLKYTLRYRRTGWNESWIVEGFDRTEAILTHLQQYTSYDVQVSAFHDPKGLLGGDDSEWSEVTSYRTEFSAPSEKFNFITINATSFPAPSDKWEVKVLWQFYVRHDEPGLYYKVSYSMLGERHQLKPLANTATFFVFGSGIVVLSGSYCNAKGCSSTTDESIDVQKTSPIHDVLLSLQSNASPKVAWALEDEESFTNAASDSNCIVRLCSSVRNPDDFHRVFKVSDDSTNVTATDCTYDPDYDVQVHCRTGKQTMSHLDISPCYQYYALVVRAVYSGTSNVLTSSTASNVLIENPLITTTGKFTATDESSQERYQINTRWAWTESLCTNLHKDLFFSVVYAPSSGAECAEDNACLGNSIYHSMIGNCSQTNTHHNITSNVYGATTYDFGLGYCCKSIRRSSSTLCFAASNVTDTVRTEIGAPEIPMQLQWNMSDLIKVTWLPPKHRNGALDGYVVNYGLVVNASDHSNYSADKSDSTEIVTTNTWVNLPIPCSDDGNNPAHWVHVSAFNLKAGENLTGPAERLEGTACLLYNSEDDWKGYTNLIVGMVFCLIFVLIVLLVAHCQRKRIKQIIRHSLWPPVPIPNVFIDLPTSRVNNEVVDDLSPSRPDNYSNPLFSKERDADSIKSPEIPDDIHDVNAWTKTDDSDKDTESEKAEIAPGSELNSMEAPCCGVPNHALESEALSSRRQYQLDTPDSPYDGSEHSPYSVITPLLSITSDGSELGDYAKTTFVGHEPSWRMMLYPNGTSSYSQQCSASSRRSRPHSFNGSSGNSFTAAGYVRQCEDRTPKCDDLLPNFKPTTDTLNSQHQVENPPLITYTKLAIDSEGGPALVETPAASHLHAHEHCSNVVHRCSCMKIRFPFTEEDNPEQRKCTCGRQNLKRLRGESWYDGYNCCPSSPPLSQMQTIAQPFVGEASTSSPPSYVGEVASYVTVPTTSGTLPIAGVTEGCTSDDDFRTNIQRSPVEVGRAISECSSGSVDSIDALYHGVRGSHTPQNQPQRNDVRSNEWPLNRGQELPADDDSLSYVKQSDTYVTVDEALNIPADGPMSPVHNGIDFIANSSNDPVDDPIFPQFRFNDDEDASLPQERFSMDNAVLHLFNGRGIHSEAEENDFQPAASDEASEFGYITTVEASDIRK